MFMKKKILFPMLAAFAIVSCNDDSSTSTTTTSNDSANTAAHNDSANNAANTPANTAPLDSSDVLFVRKAAMGGKMEVTLGNLAQQNAANDRVKGFGSMMVTDHGQANNELMQFAQSHNVMLTDSLDKKTKDHVTSMEKMKGKAFDKHYIGMMVNDHQKDISEFEKASNNAINPDLKAWAAKTLPVLRKHLDSAQAINKAKL